MQLVVLTINLNIKDVNYHFLWNEMEFVSLFLQFRNEWNTVNNINNNIKNK